MLTPGADPRPKGLIVARGIALDVTLSAPEADRFSYDRAYLLGKIKVALGGGVAEELVECAQRCVDARSRRSAA